MVRMICTWRCTESRSADDLAARLEHGGQARGIAHGLLEATLEFTRTGLLRREEHAHHGHGHDDRGGEPSSHGSLTLSPSPLKAAPSLMELRRALALLAGAGQEIDLDLHGESSSGQATVRRASPTGSMRSGATSSVAMNSMAPSRTVRRASGLAACTGMRRRSPSHGRSPGTREPPPHANTARAWP